jgi:WW domain
MASDSDSSSRQSSLTESHQPPLPSEPLPSEPAVQRQEPADTAPKAVSDTQPPLPSEEVPPLPDEAPPDDGWEPVWDATAQAFYFYNRFTKKNQWENPRVPTGPTAAAPASSSSTVAGLGAHDRNGSDSPPRTKGGYNPAIHGDYDPNADYAQLEADSDEEREREDAAAAAGGEYGATGTFNRFTGRWQAATITPENFNDESKSRRQMSAFFDVDAAANSHDGRSLKAERQNKKFSRKEIKAFKEKRRERKEEKRRAWLRD